MWRYYSGTFLFQGLGILAENALVYTWVDRITENNVGSVRFRCWALDFHLNTTLEYICAFEYILLYSWKISIIMKKDYLPI